MQIWLDETHEVPPTYRAFEDVLQTASFVARVLIVALMVCLGLVLWAFSKPENKSLPGVGDSKVWIENEKRLQHPIEQPTAAIADALLHAKDGAK